MYHWGSLCQRQSIDAFEYLQHQATERFRLDVYFDGSHHTLLADDTSNYQCCLVEPVQLGLGLGRLDIVYLAIFSSLPLAAIVVFRAGFKGGKIPAVAIEESAEILADLSKNSHLVNS